MEEEKVFDFPQNLSDTDVSTIKAMLPDWKTKVQEVSHLKNSNMLIKCAIAAKTVDEIKEWISAYQERTNSVYSIKSTEKTSGIYVDFKQRLHCQHKTRCRRTYEPYKKNNTKNTNCPANINVTLRAVKKVYRGKSPTKAPIPEMPCEVVLQIIHNHETTSADSLRFQAVSVETREKLLNLFQQGHTPATALESLKMDVQLNNDDFEKHLANRKYCPSYNYCYHLYKSEFMKKYGPVDISNNELLYKQIDKYNEETMEKSVQAVFEDTDYAICICPPLLRRVHKHIKSSSKVVFMDSNGIVNSHGSRIFILSADAACGALPLAVIITSSESPDIISTGLGLLKSMLGETLFRGNMEGPDVFITDDSISEQNAINSVFKKSTVLLCNFHVLQSVWRWLVEAKNSIKLADQANLFVQFKAIMYATSTNEFNLKYKEALEGASSYPNYIKYLDDYFQRKELWALAYRSNLLIRGHDTKNNSEAAMRLLKDKIFQRTKAYNLLQTLDFIMTKFLLYYQRRVLDAAHNRSRKSIFNIDINLPSAEIMKKIQTASDTIYLVPSEKKSVFYIVNTEVLHCTCEDGMTGKICKHVHWACSIVYSEPHAQSIDNAYIRRQLYLIATGSEPVENGLKPLFGNNNNTCTTESMQVDSIPSPSAGTSDAQLRTEINTETLKEENKKIVQEIMASFLSYSEKSPLEVGVALKKMAENLNKIRTVSAFATSCTMFAREF